MRKTRKKKYDYSKLRGRIVEKFGTVRAFAEAYGISYTSMSAKLNGRIAISMADIEKMSEPEFLDIHPSEYHEYFFKYQVCETQTERG